MGGAGENVRWSPGCAFVAAVLVGGTGAELTYFLITEIVYLAFCIFRVCFSGWYWYWINLPAVC